jgi:nucleotide-binding universal stress UspA family protein
MERNILAAVDGSVFSFNALRYLGQLFTDLNDISIHLLYVLPSPPPPIGSEWVEEQDRLLSLSPTLRASYAGARRFMEEAVLQLGRRGIAPGQVSCAVQLSRVGVTADIVAEAKRGFYDALLIGRRGVGAVEEMIGGSVSSTAAQHCSEIPLWVVDGKVNARKFLLPVDSSFNALKAADHLGFILEGNPYAEIVLLHLPTLITGDTKPDWPVLHALWGKDWCAEHLGRADSIFSGPEQLLQEHGIGADRLRRRQGGHCLTPQRSICKQAVLEDCGTIVLGRRCPCQTKSFLHGVSDKVLAIADQVAIWVVG